MKLLAVSAVAGWWCCALANPPLTVQAGRVTLTAASIERQDAAAPASSGYASVFRLKGNARIRTCCLLVPGADTETRKYFVLRADEAEYHQDSGAIEARGHVRIEFQAPRQPAK